MMRKKRKNHGDGPPMVDPKKGGGVPKSSTKMSKTSTLFHFQQSSQWLGTISYVTFSLTVLIKFWRNTIEKYKCFSKATRMVMVIFTENANLKIFGSFLAPKKRVHDFFFASWEPSWKSIIYKRASLIVLFLRGFRTSKTKTLWMDCN